MKTKPAKPNGWELMVEIATDTYKLSDYEWIKKYGDKSYKDVFKEKFSQAILSAEKETVKRCIEVIENEETPVRSWTEMKKILIKALSLPDQEQLSNSKTDE